MERPAWLGVAVSQWGLRFASFARLSLGWTFQPAVMLLNSSELQLEGGKQTVKKNYELWPGRNTGRTHCKEGKENDFTCDLEPWNSLEHTEWLVWLKCEIALSKRSTCLYSSAHHLITTCISLSPILVLKEKLNYIYLLIGNLVLFCLLWLFGALHQAIFGTITEKSMIEAVKISAVDWGLSKLEVK